MAYRLKPSEKPSTGMARIIAEQIGQFGAPPADADGRAIWVHETRKGLKRLRALLRLLQVSAPTSELAASQQALRDLGRQLSAERIRTVLPKTLQSLAEGADADIRKAIAGALISLEEERNLAKAEPAPKHGAGPHVIDSIHAFAEAASSLTAGCTINSVIRAAGKTYVRGRRRLEAAYDQPGPETFHELRKQVQLHWRHCQILSRAWPEEMALRTETARRLSSILGRENDLAEACEWLSNRRGGVLPAKASRALLELAGRERTICRETARPLATRLYAEKRDALESRLQAYWDATDHDRQAQRSETRTDTPQRHRRRTLASRTRRK